TSLGTVDTGTLIASGATLDLNGSVVGAEALIVSGDGVGGNGAIINSGADNINAVQNVTLVGNTTFGGTGRWDIRGGVAALSTGGVAYNLTKTGLNQFSLVGAAVDSTLGNINILQGTFSAETTTSSLGNPAGMLTVAAGATFQLFGAATAFDKVFVFN